MYKIVSKEYFSPKVVKLVVQSPEIARARRPGHFVIVRCGDKGERIPLTIADADVLAGTITLVVQDVGFSTHAICGLEVGDSFTDVVGPLGKATQKYQISTDVSLNTIMVDGTGMCGACRVTVGGKTRFVCVDGPEFDAHQVDFDEMLMRLHAYD